MKKQLKIAAVAALLALGGFSASAQQETEDLAKTDRLENKAISSLLNGTVKVIDNKGTKKFLQVKNGLTLLTNQTPKGGIVSTWQLGGTLTDNTYIDAEGAMFALDGIKLIDVSSTDAGNTPASTAVTKSKGKGVSAETGYAFLVRDEGTGETKKLLAKDLVKSGHIIEIAAAGGVIPALADVSIPAEVAKVSVYRNGAKLIADTDYTVAAGTVTLTPVTSGSSAWALYEEDTIEVHWIN